MTAIEFADTIIQLPVNKQNEFFDVLKDYLSKEDWMTTVKAISLHGLFHNPEKYEALKKAICAALVEELFQ